MKLKTRNRVFARIASGGDLITILIFLYNVHTKVVISALTMFMIEFLKKHQE